MNGQIEKFLLEWSVVNALSFILLYVCLKWQKAGRYIFGFVFLAASGVNSYLGLFRPSVYLDYGELTWFSFYKAFIYGFFSQHTTAVILIIAACQFLIALGLFLGGKLFVPAILGATVFLLAIVPLGVGSAFPATLIMSLGLLYLLKKRPGSLTKSDLD
jgi:hypothetical protein